MVKARAKSSEREITRRLMRKLREADINVAKRGIFTKDPTRVYQETNKLKARLKRLSRGRKRIINRLKDSIDILKDEDAIKEEPVAQINILTRHLNSVKKLSNDLWGDAQLAVKASVTYQQGSYRGRPGKWEIKLGKLADEAEEKEKLWGNIRHNMYLAFKRSHQALGYARQGSIEQVNEILGLINNICRKSIEALGEEK